jgi:Domain of unknown function (DUF222)
MPADDARGRPTSRHRGSRAAGAGGPEGAETRFELDFSSCLAMAWPGQAGLEEMLLAAGVGGAPDTAEPEAPVQPEAPIAGDKRAEELAAGPLDAARSVPFSELAGRVVEDMRPGPGLAGWLSRAEVSDLAEYELAGVAAASRRLASWAAAAELTAVAEMAARATARDTAIPIEADGRPASVSQEAAAEVGLALTMSQFGAALWADLAVTLRWRLPGTQTALAEGRVDLPRARLIAELTGVLNDADARAVEEKILGRAEHQTTGQLRAALRRAVISIDPAAAQRRRIEAERRARVGLFADEEGTATLSGRNLPGVQACAAMARITALAQAMKAAGAAGGIDLLRAQVLIGLLLNTLPGIPPPLEDPAAPGPVDPGQGGARDSGSDDPPDQGPDDPPDRDPDDPRDGPGGGGSQTHGGDGGSPAGGDGESQAGQASDRGSPRDSADGPGGLKTNPQASNEPRDERTGQNDSAADTAGSRAPPTTGRDGAGPPTPAGAGPAWPPLPPCGGAEMPTSGCPPGHPGRVRMLVAWRTLAGMSAEPGSVCWLGPITPNAARELAEMAAGNPRTEWRIIVTDDAGQAMLVTRVPRRPGTATRPAGSGLVSRITLTLSLALVNDLARPGSAPMWKPTGSGNLGKVLAAALAAASQAVGRAESVPGPGRPGRPGGTRSGKTVKGCNHPEAEAHYRPSDRLREFVIARDQTCRFAVCRQPAWAADLDHTVAFDDGGPTCRCNTGPVCRTHHKIKQRPGWRLEQPEPGIFEWTTPAGRRYLVTPAQYPV